MRIKRTMKWLIGACTAATLLCSGIAFADTYIKLNANLGYVNVKDLPPGCDQINPIRLAAIRETATQLGARGALAWRSIQVNHSLTAEANYLNHVFDFNQLLLDSDVLPPVLVEADNSLNLASDDALRLASKIYKIESPARFITAAPNWRDYLWMNYQKPNMPDQSLLPTTCPEARAWNNFLEQGWKQGLIQANEIFSVNLNRLKRDYMGMVLYRKLLAQHMVSAPFVAAADLGVTGDANELRINDRVLRITAVSQLQTDPNQWKPVLTGIPASSSANNTQPEEQMYMK